MTQFKRASVLSLVMAIFAVFLTVQSVMAAGTKSDTTISNRATISYSVGTVPQTVIESSEAGNSTPGVGLGTDTDFLVDNIVNLNVVSNGDRDVTPGAVNIALPFTITNTGNTTQGYSLQAVPGTTDIPMTPATVRIYIDEGTTPGSYDTGDTEYTLGTNVRDLNPNGAPGLDSINVIIVANAPAAATVDSLTDTYSLLAITLDEGTATETEETVGGDTAGVDVVFADNELDPALTAGPEDAANDGKHSASGVYTITSAVLTIAKTSVVISDPINDGSDPKAIPGAIVTYSIIVSNAGTVAADAVTVVDTIPVNTDYSANSITIGGTDMSDEADADAADHNITKTNAVTAVIGTIPAAGSVTVTFNVEIQ